MNFDKRKTNMVKSIAIVLMLMHHLFGCATSFCITYGTSTAFISWESFQAFCLYGAKACVGIFTFLSAYGITKGLKLASKEGRFLSKSELEKICLKRYAKLAMNFLIVWGLTVLTSFLRPNGLMGVYGQEGWKRGVLYALIDSLGLSSYFSTPSLNETWWYMSIAILIIFIVPVLVWIYIKFGKILIGISVLLFLLGFSQTNFTIYLFCIIIGISCAEDNILEEIFDKKWFACGWINNFFKLDFWLIVCIGLFVLRIKTVYSYWLDPIIAIACCQICMNVCGLIPIIERPMVFLGKHSMNIFLIHTLIFEYYFTGFIYRYNNWIIDLMLLLFTSLICSVLIEFIKKYLNIAINKCLNYAEKIQKR